jgi:hypothetical protein
MQTEIQTIQTFNIQTIQNIVQDTSPVDTGWILEFGVWDDTRSWVDGELWNDGV